MKKIDEKENKNVECCNTKKIIICAVTAIAVVLVILAIVFGIKSCGKENNEKQLKTNLMSIAKSFYEDFYYPQMEKTQDDVTEYMKRFENAGIKVNLANMSKVSKVDKELVKAMVNSETKEKCDEEKTTVRITPKAPYGKTDYDIEVNLECGFKKAK